MAEKSPASQSPPKRLRVALAGNPNAGKTTIFNQLTGTRQHVGNYPGVTVEVKDGWFRHGAHRVDVYDLPGTYCLTAYSDEELVARDFVIHEKPDVVVDIVDSSNLERNLYLATQFMELGVPLILAFNMSDMAKARGFKIDIELLSKLLGVTIVPMVGHRGQGVAELKDAIHNVAENRESHRPAKVHYGNRLEREIQELVGLLEKEADLCAECPPRWIAVKLIENDKEVRQRLSHYVSDAGPILKRADEIGQRLERDFSDSPEVLVADRRYGFISGACQEAVVSTVESRHTMSDSIDAIVTNQALGLPIFFALMYLMFKLTFALGDPPMRWIEAFFDWAGGALTAAWPWGPESALLSLLVDGILGGVGGVLVFLPNILLLFLTIAVLEDSGYMARAAFVMDRFMHKIGLHGKSFIPMLIGFGCTVPGIMATRILETRRDRLTTMLVLPLMSCGARLPIYGLFIPAFFPQAWRAPLLWGIYLIGILLAIVLIKLLRVSLFRGESTPFVMELPPYRMPTVKGALIHMWERGWLFVRKAGTVILAISILLWAMTTYPKPSPEQVKGLPHAQVGQVTVMTSYAGRVGKAIEPVMRPIGFDWKSSTAMIGAFAAKEVFVAQLSIVNALGEEHVENPATLRELLPRQYSPLQAFCMMLFCLISAPCVMTIIATWQESGSWKWAALQLGGLTALGYVVALIVYQSGLLLGIGVS